MTLVCQSQQMRLVVKLCLLGRGLTKLEAENFTVCVLTLFNTRPLLTAFLVGCAIIEIVGRANM